MNIIWYNTAMARPLRVEYEEAVYHILSRRNQGKQIFSDDGDREYFVEILQRAGQVQMHRDRY